MPDWIKSFYPTIDGLAKLGYASQVLAIVFTAIAFLASLGKDALVAKKEREDSKLQADKEEKSNSKIKSLEGDLGVSRTEAAQHYAELARIKTQVKLTQDWGDFSEEQKIAIRAAVRDSVLVGKQIQIHSEDSEPESQTVARRLYKIMAPNGEIEKQVFPGVSISFGYISNDPHLRGVHISASLLAQCVFSRFRSLILL